jgi:hypothetical protein
MKVSAEVLKNEMVTLEPADEQNVELLIHWTLDPVAKGPSLHEDDYYSRLWQRVGREGTA